MKSFALERVKAFKETPDIELAPITVFVGQNSSGKSSLVRFPAVLAQSVNSHTRSIALYKKNGLIDYGTFEDVIYRHKGVSFSIRLSFDFDVLSTNPYVSEWFNGQEDESSSEKVVTSLKIRFEKRDGDIVISDYSLLRNARLLFTLKLRKDGRYILVKMKNEKQSAVESVDFRIVYPNIAFSSLAASIDCQISDESQIDIIGQLLKEEVHDLDDDSVKVLAWELKDYLNPGGSMSEQQIDRYLRPDVFISGRGFAVTKEMQRRIYNVFNSLRELDRLAMKLNMALSLDLADVTYIGPFRTEPERIIRRDESWIRDYVGSQGEMMPHLLINDFLKSGESISAVSEWCMKILKCRIGIHPIGHDLFELRVQKNNQKFWSSIMDVGYGVSQVLPVIAQLVFLQGRPKNIPSTVIVEQPELHLHPNSQAELAGLFAAAVRDRTKSRIIIETHSEHLIRGLQLLIADKSNANHLDVGQVRIYYVYGEDDAGESAGRENRVETEGSRIEEMKMDENGQFIRKWPSGFFDKAYELTGQIIEAISRG